MSLVSLRQNSEIEDDPSVSDLMSKLSAAETGGEGDAGDSEEPQR
jgi:hypothetical protein